MRTRLALEELCGLWGAALADRRTPVMAYVRRYINICVFQLMLLNLSLPNDWRELCAACVGLLLCVRKGSDMRGGVTAAKSHPSLATGHMRWHER